MNRSRTFFRKCFVPNCKNTSTNSRNKIFVHVSENLKKSWCAKVRRSYLPKQRLYCCEDHLNLEEDLENYDYWTITKSRPILKTTAKLRLDLSTQIGIIDNIYTENRAPETSSSSLKQYLLTSSESIHESPITKKQCDKSNCVVTSGSSIYFQEKEPSFTSTLQSLLKQDISNKPTASSVSTHKIQEKLPALKKLLLQPMLQEVTKCVSEDTHKSTASFISTHLKTAKRIITRPKNNHSSDTSSSSGDDNLQTLFSEDESSTSWEPGPSHRKKTRTEDLYEETSAERQTTQQQQNDLTSVCGDDHLWTLDSEDENYDVFQCNECLSEISGFRYTCVQCTDWDLCAECDKKGAHAHHFVLRVPRGCNFSKAETVKETIFDSLIRLFQNQAKAEVIPTDSSKRLVKEEVIDEEDNNFDGDSSLYTESALTEEEVACGNFESILNPIKTEDEEAIDRLFTEPEEPSTSIETLKEREVPDTIQQEPLTTSRVPRRQMSVYQRIPKKTVPPKKPIAQRSMSQNPSELNPITHDVTMKQPQEAAPSRIVDCGLPFTIKTESVELTTSDSDDDLIIIRKLSKQ